MKTVLLTLTLLLSSTAFAVEKGRDSSEELLRQCVEAEKQVNGGKPENAVQAVDAFRCGYYLNGFRDAMDYAPRPAFCVPIEVTSGQLVRVVVKYLRDNPSKLYLDKADGTRAALQAAYPCR